MSDAAFGKDELLHYAMARYACQWLDERDKLWAFYHAFRDGIADDPTGEEAFTAVVGKAPKDANEQWVTWVQRMGSRP